mmetsp:Transcript_4988/g.5716  ORF Transcript_4988/g.5716 Transcript_4988/m.5716 type:complete len:290 (-) Transcript_4988:429-1298(-)
METSFSVSVLLHLRHLHRRHHFLLFLLQHSQDCHEWLHRYRHRHRCRQQWQVVIVIVGGVGVVLIIRVTTIFFFFSLPYSLFLIPSFWKTHPAFSRRHRPLVRPLFSLSLPRFYFVRQSLPPRHDLVRQARRPRFYLGGPAHRRRFSLVSPSRPPRFYFVRPARPPQFYLVWLPLRHPCQPFRHLSRRPPSRLLDLSWNPKRPTAKTDPRWPPRRRSSISRTDAAPVSAFSGSDDDDANPFRLRLPQSWPPWHHGHDGRTTITHSPPNSADLRSSILNSFPTKRYLLLK